MGTNRILVVDDDPLIRGSLYELLRGQRLDVEMAADGGEAMEHLTRRPFRLVIADVRMPQVDGMSLLAHIRTCYPDTVVILITGFGRVNAAVEAMREGAFDYLTKPIQSDELDAAIQRALLEPAQPETTPAHPSAVVMGQHPSIQQLLHTISLVAVSPATILLYGESGTGKRLMASTIHRADPKRCGKPFVEVSCGALPETLLDSELFGHVRGAFTGAIRDRQGRFELADGGTILLDEIDTCSPALQVKLLRVLQERAFERVGDTITRTVDVRVIAATNRALEPLVKGGQFRQDLYYRLNVIALQLPPLRERASDIPLLVDGFLTRACARSGKTVQGMSEEAMRLLVRYSWPGNIRELENVIERAVILTRHELIGVDGLPEVLRVGASGSSSAQADRLDLKQALQAPEREMILKILEEVRWSRSEAAKRLGIHRSTLYHKLRHLRIDAS